MSFADLWVMTSGLTAIALLQFGNEAVRRAAPFIGLAGQPAWIWIALEAHRPGVLIVTLAYAVLWALGCLKVLKERAQ